MKFNSLNKDYFTYTANNIDLMKIQEEVKKKLKI